MRVRAVAVAFVLLIIWPFATRPTLAAGPYGKIVVGNWSGGAFTHDATGSFSHCAVNAAYRNGTRMLTSVTAQFNWLIGFSNPGWTLKPGDKLSLRLVFDRSSTIDVTAEVRTPVLVTIAMPANSALITAFRQGRYLEVVAADTRLTFALTSTSEMLPALVECVRQSANIKGPVSSSPTSGQPPAPASEAQAKAQAEKKALLEKTRDLIRSRMLACIGREGASMLLTDEKAEVVAKAAMIFCKADVDALIQSTVEIIEVDGGRPTNRQAVKDAAEKQVQDVVMAQVVRTRGQMLERRNQQQPAPSTAPQPRNLQTL